METSTDTYESFSTYQWRNRWVDLDWFFELEFVAGYDDSGRAGVWYANYGPCDEITGHYFVAVPAAQQYSERLAHWQDICAAEQREFERGFNTDEEPF
jgi:hypothetical protein